MADRKVLVLGATGGTGQQVVAEALRRGFSVTAFVRDPSRLEIKSDRLNVQIGELTGDEAPLAFAMHGQISVVSALGVGKSFKSGGFIEQVVSRIVRCMDAASVRRLVFTSAFGVGETWRDAPMIPRLFMRTLLRDVYRDKAAGEAEIRRSRLDWTIVYPTGLTNHPATGSFRVGERLALRGFPAISRGDLASFLVDQIEDMAHVRKGVLVSS